MNNPKYLYTDKNKRILTEIPICIFIFFCLFSIACSRDNDIGKNIKEETIPALNGEINADSLKALVTWMEGMGTRFSLAPNHRYVALKIRNRFKSLGYTNAHLDSFMITRKFREIDYNQWQYNVIATLEGNVHPDSVCILGAHYDNALITGDPFTIVPGANDNASGVAAALEVARVMKKKNFTPGNTIEFVAFGSEELGLLGSYANASFSRQNSKKIKLMLNNDMIAYQNSSNQAEWAVNIIDYDNSHDLRAEAEKASTVYTLLNYTNDNTYNKQSDSYPFFLYDYKALFFFSDNIDPGYHSLNDITANCNFEYCREVVRISCSLLIANSW